MANELTLNINVQFSKGNYKASISPGALTYTVSGTLFNHETSTVTTSDGTLPKGSIGTIGYAYVRNLDTTNFVELGVDGTNYVVKLKAGEISLFRVDGAALHAKANTASCNVEYLLIED